MQRKMTVRAFKAETHPEKRRRLWFARKLRQARDAADISQDALAVGLGIDQAIISRIELGRRPLTLERLELICEQFPEIAVPILRHLVTQAGYVMGPAPKGRAAGDRTMQARSIRELGEFLSQHADALADDVFTEAEALRVEEQALDAVEVLVLIINRCREVQRQGMQGLSK